MIPIPIFIDTNVHMYAVGRPHRLRQPCIEVLNLVADNPQHFFSNAEVLQELLHRYMALRLWPEPGYGVLERSLLLFEGRVESITAEDVEGAATRAFEYPNSDSRDLVHAAVMKRVGATHIVSADTGFDRIPEVVRLDPADVETWRDELVEED